MDPYIIEQLFTARHDDLVREAGEYRLAKDAREEEQPAPKPKPRTSKARKLGFTG